MPAGWESFFTAELGATAGLAGLAIVAISPNLSRIRAFPELPGHAAGGMPNTWMLLAEISR
jgi:hypothetical protein